MDLGRAEGELEGPRGGEFGQIDPEFFGEDNPDQRGAPVGVESFHGAGLFQDRAACGGAATALILRFKVIQASFPGDPPDLPDRLVGQPEFQSDLAQILAGVVAADDLESNRHG